MCRLRGCRQRLIAKVSTRSSSIAWNSGVSTASTCAISRKYPQDLLPSHETQGSQPHRLARPQQRQHVRKNKGKNVRKGYVLYIVYAVPRIHSRIPENLCIKDSVLCDRWSSRSCSIACNSGVSTASTRAISTTTARTRGTTMAPGSQSLSLTGARWFYETLAAWARCIRPVLPGLTWALHWERYILRALIDPISCFEAFLNHDCHLHTFKVIT